MHRTDGKRRSGTVLEVVWRLATLSHASCRISQVVNSIKPSLSTTVLCEPEVPELYVALRVVKDVGRLEIPMDDSLMKHREHFFSEEEEQEKQDEGAGA
jgi:hypothetical protein